MKLCESKILVIFSRIVIEVGMFWFVVIGYFGNSFGKWCEEIDGIVKLGFCFFFIVEERNVKVWCIRVNVICFFLCIVVSIFFGYGKF